MVERAASRALIAASAVFGSLKRGFTSVVRIAVAIGESSVAGRCRTSAARARCFSIGRFALFSATAAIGERIECRFATVGQIVVAIGKTGLTLYKVAGNAGTLGQGVGHGAFLVAQNTIGQCI
jgi:hypothetical protein